MKPRSRSMFAALVAVLTTSMAMMALPASAASDDSVTPLEVYLDSLPESERQAFTETRLPATTTLEVLDPIPADAEARRTARMHDDRAEDVGFLATGCWTQRVNGSAQAAAGNTLYTFYTVGYWCSSGSTITAASLADAGGETSTPGWRYEGVTASDSGITQNEGRSYASHKFVLGSYGIDIQTSNECLRHRGFTDGTGVGEYVCGIY